MPHNILPSFDKFLDPLFPVDQGTVPWGVQLTASSPLTTSAQRLFYLNNALMDAPGRLEFQALQSAWVDAADVIDEHSFAARLACVLRRLMDVLDGGNDEIAFGVGHVIIDWQRNNVVGGSFRYF